MNRNTVSTPSCRSASAADGVEYAYMVKYPERRLSSAKLAGDSWRIRQTAVYHQYDCSTKKSIWILLNPLPGSVAQMRAEAWLRGMNSSESSCNLRHLHMDKAILSGYIDNWRPYLAEHNAVLLPLVRSVSYTVGTLLKKQQMGLIHATRLNQKISADFDTMTDVHYTKRQLLLVDVILDSCIRNVEQLQQVGTHLTAYDGSCVQCQGVSQSSNYQWVHLAKEKYTSTKRMALYLSEECNMLLEMLTKRLEFQDKVEVQKQSEYLLQLTKSAVDDSVAVRVITFITLVYLSCTVVGVS